MDPIRTETIVLPAQAHSARAARRFIRRVLHDWHCESLSDTSELLASEVVTNALLHAGSAVELVVRRQPGPRIRVEVGDHSGVAPVVNARTPGAATGRGLVLVDALSARWGVTAIPNDLMGKRVWFEVT